MTNLFAAMKLPETRTLQPGMSVTIPLGTHFQFRAGPEAPLAVVVAITMPPWPGEDEACPVPGTWPISGETRV